MACVDVQYVKNKPSGFACRKLEAKGGKQAPGRSDVGMVRSQRLFDSCSGPMHLKACVTCRTTQSYAYRAQSRLPGVISWQR